MTPCILCDGTLRPYTDEVRDWEYAVDWNTPLLRCDNCGLVTHDPQIKPDQIPGLYPSNYMAHSGASGGSGVYGRLKKILADRSTKALDPHLPAGGTMLEIGSGNGHFLAKVAARRGDVQLIGVDIVDPGEIDLPNYRFLHGQLQDIEIDADSVDLIYCSNLIEHVADPIEFVEICARILRPGGTIYGVTPNHRSIDRRLFGRYWAGYHYPRHTYVFNDRNLTSLLENTGFTDVTMSGSYGFWYLSLANRFVELPGTKKRGLPFAAVTAAFAPLDLVLSRFYPHGSMTFTGVREA